MERLARPRAGAQVRDGSAEAMTGIEEVPVTSGYARYLTAKTTGDDRELNRPVLAEVRRLLPGGPRGRRGCLKAAPTWGRWRPACWTGASLAQASMSCWMLIGSCWTGRGFGCATGPPRGGCGPTSGQMACRLAIWGCAWCTPSSAITWRLRQRSQPTC